jgi:hypothetical protein
LTLALHLQQLLIILSMVGDILIDNEALLVSDFVNLKIKPVQSFGGSRRDGVCVYVHMGE